MAEPGFALLFDNLEAVDAFEIFLPLLLFLAIYFGLLKKTEAIGDDDAVIGVASIAMSFITVFGVLMFVPANFFPQFFGVSALVLIAVLSAILILGMTGFEFGAEGNRYAQLTALGVGVLVIVMAVPSVVGELFQVDLGSVAITSEVWGWLTTLALIGVMLYSVKYLAGNGE